MAALSRRSWLTLALASSPLASCGFALRQTPQLPFDTVYLSGFLPGSTMAQALRQALTLSTTQVVETPDNAQAILTSELDAKQHVMAGSNAAGQVREVQLQTRFRFSVKTAAGKTWLTSTEIVLTRDLTYNERHALAKEQEEEASHQAMQQDIAQQVLRRLSALKA
jgi:LPS-assembly lipoprotein